MRGMNTVFAVIFGVWATAWLTIEATFPLWPAWVWGALPVAFLLPELVGAARASSIDDGDTGSESFWVFVADRPARKRLAFFVGLALAFRGASLPFIFAGVEHWTIQYGPWLLIWAGVAAWLVDHFPNMGRGG